MSRRLADGQLPDRNPNSNKGRTPEITEDIIESMCKVIEAGAHPITAIKMHGFDESNFKKWMRKGRRSKKSIYGVLFQKFTQSIAKWEVNDLVRIEMAANGRKGEVIEKEYEDRDGRWVIERRIVNEIRPDWRAAAWRLERRAKERWGRDDIPHLNPFTEDDAIDVTPNREKKKQIDRAILMAKRLEELQGLDEDEDK